VFIGAKEWAEDTFKDSDLHDSRRTRRLIKVAASYAKNIGASTLACCDGDEAQIEGAYRLLRNENITPEAIRNGGYRATARNASKEATILAIEDTTTISYKHQATKELGYTSNSLTARSKGFNVHSVLLMSEKTTQTIGLIEQTWNCRDNAEYGKRENRHVRDYKEKESYKWEHASRQMSKILGKKMTDVVSVCDREADIYDYLHYKLSNNQRFIVRAKSNRVVLTTGHKLFEQVFLSKPLGTYKLKVQQRGGRKEREAKIRYYSASIDLVLPKSQRNKGYPETLQLNIVASKEYGNKLKEERLEWIILTTEKADTMESARLVLRNYELRWRIEDFHKAWKSGVGVENLRLQSKENLERGGSILAFIAVRLLQLREIALHNPKKLKKTIPVTHLLQEDEWKILWITIEKKKLPKKKPDVIWAYKSIGKLGGWYDSKRTGIVGWKALWKGWFKLVERIESYKDVELYL